jgi:hypothetical protein
LFPSARSATPVPPPGEGDSFAKTAALETALNNTPDIRSDAVARGLALVNNTNYPSPTEIKQLSGFLANQLQSSQD